MFEKGQLSDVPCDHKDVQQIIETVFPRTKPPLTGDALRSVLKIAEAYTLVGVLKWCWARLPGGVVTWKVYEKFKVEEERTGFKYDAYSTVLSRCVDSVVHETIISDFTNFIIRVLMLQPPSSIEQLVRLAGTWAFELIRPNQEAPTSFGDGVSCWSVAAEAFFHFYLAFLRTFLPMAGSEEQVVLPLNLVNFLMNNKDYPPQKSLSNRQLMTVPKITLTVGKLSASPFVLLKRVSQSISLSDPDQFNTQDDYTTLRYLFDDPKGTDSRLTPESKRILLEITDQNTIFNDHVMKIKDTVRLPYDLRGRTWSKSYNHCYIDPITGDPHRPFTNYVYEDHQRESIMKSRLPSSERQNAPYPTSPNPEKVRPMQVGTWNEVLNFYSQASNSEKYANLEAWNRQRKIANDNQTTCDLARIAIDDFFVWVWMSSLSDEQTEATKALFGRSIVVEVDLSGVGDPRQRRWVVIEEVLSPRPPPLKPKSNIVDPPFEVGRRVVSTPSKFPKQVKEKRAKSERRPVKTKKIVTSPSVHKPKPVKMPESVKMPEPALLEPEVESTRIMIHYDNFDPLVEAIAQRLKKQNIDHQTQTVVDNGVQTEDELHGISTDEGNSKGCQTEVSSVKSAPISRHVSSSATQRQAVTSQAVAYEKRLPVQNTQVSNHDILPLSKYDFSSPQSHTLDKLAGFEEDYMITPILSDLPKKQILPDLSRKEKPKATPQSYDEESFVTAIDTSFPSTNSKSQKPQRKIPKFQRPTQVFDEGLFERSSSAGSMASMRRKIPRDFDNHPLTGPSFPTAANVGHIDSPLQQPRALFKPNTGEESPMTIDDNYRYDERPKDSPDSGYAQLPLRGFTKNGSDSDVSRIGGLSPENNSRITRDHVAESASVFGGSSQRTGSSNLEPKWQDVRNTLQGMASQRPTVLPAIMSQITVDKNAAATNANTLVGGVASPEDYINATVTAKRRPSVNTGDHVKNIVISGNTSSGAGGIPRVVGLSKNDIDGQYNDDDDENYTRYGTGLLLRDNQEKMFPDTTRMPRATSNPIQTKQVPDNSLYPSTKYDLFGPNPFPTPTSKPRGLVYSLPPNPRDHTHGHHHSRRSLSTSNAGSWKKVEVEPVLHNNSEPVASYNLQAENNRLAYEQKQVQQQMFLQEQAHKNNRVASADKGYSSMSIMGLLEWSKKKKRKDNQEEGK